MVNYQGAQGVQLTYTAYSIDASALAGAAAQITGSWSLDGSEDLSTYVAAFLDNWTQDVVSPMVDPLLFLPKGVVDYTGLAASITDIEFDYESNTVDLSLVTFDANLDVLTSPAVSGNIPPAGGVYGGGTAFIRGDVRLWSQVSRKINLYSPDRGGSATYWYYDLGSTEQENRAYPFFKGQQADLLRQVIAATGMYFRYGVATINAAANGPYVTMARLPNKIVVGEFQKFSVKLGQQNTSQTLNIVNYNTTGRNFGNIFLATDIYQVGNNETVTITVDVGGTPNPFNIVQPIAVDAMFQGFYTDGSGYSTYVVTGSDSLPIPAARWVAGGGKMTATIGDKPNEVILTITGADDPSLAPFTISEGPDFPALMLGCAGGAMVEFDPKTISIPTCVVDRTFNAPTTDPITIDNQFVVTELQAYDVAVPTLAQITSPLMTANFSFTDIIQNNTASSPTATKRGGYGLDEMIGSIFYKRGNYWRIMNLTYDCDSGVYTGTALQWNLAGDVDAAYAGLTAADVQTIIGSKTAAQFEAAPIPNQFGVGY